MDDDSQDEVFCLENLKGQANTSYKNDLIGKTSSLSSYYLRVIPKPVIFY